MKKYLFSSVLAIATALTGAVVLTSCSHDDVTYSEENVQQAKHAEALAQYQQSFIGIFGQPTSNQCWDFTLAKSVVTRSDSKAMTDWPRETANNYGFTWSYATGNDDPMKEDVVAKIFHNNMKEITDEIDAVDEIDWNPSGTIIYRPIATCQTASALKYFSVGADLGKDCNWNLRQIKTVGTGLGNTSGQHTSAINFDEVKKAGTVTWYAVNTNQKTTSIDASAAANELKKFKEIKVTVNDKTYTFWCFKCSANGSYADFIWWVQEAPGTPTYKYSKRYFVEDLGGVGSSDIDFNDIVFDVVEYTDGKQECIIRALGGTIPITINVCGTSWSKPEGRVNDMINTGVDGNEIDYTMVFDRFTISGWTINDNSRISVTVKDKTGFSFINSFPGNGEIPLIVAFSTAKTWKAERQAITQAWMSEAGEPAED